MKWYWLQDKETIEQLRVYWGKGTKNDADYVKNHHSPTHDLQI